MELEASCRKISEAVALAYKNFEEEGIIEEMTLDSKVAQLAEIEDNLRKKVTQLEEKRRPNTAPEVLESRTNIATQGVKRMEEAHKTCAKVLDQVSQNWEALMDDEQ